MNLYRGCAHGCAYCDGRAEAYAVEGTFEEVAYKANALELLARELETGGRRKPLPGGYVLLGGGVGDSYQPAERVCRLARGALEILRDRGLPVHALTKSSLVERDLDLLIEIQKRRGAIVSVSLSTVDEGLAALFEPGASPPADRLRTVERCRAAGIPAGVVLIPVIPYVTDWDEPIGKAVAAAASAGAQFVLFGGMTLQPGRQAEHFLRVLAETRPHLVDGVRRLYGGGRWGAASGGYHAEVSARFLAAARRHGMPRRIPAPLFRGLLSVNERVSVMLEHIDHELRAEGKRSSYGAAAYAVSRLREPLDGSLFGLPELPGVRGETLEAVRGIAADGTCALYERLMAP